MSAVSPSGTNDMRPAASTVRPFALSRRNVVCFFFGLGVALSPIYLLQSGGVQPAHLMLLIALILGLRRLIPLARIDLLLVAYVLYDCLRAMGRASCREGVCKYV